MWRDSRLLGRRDSGRFHRLPGGEVVDFQRRARVGLTLNVKKCETIGLNRVSRNIWEETDFAKSFLEPSMETANLLGAPLFSEGLNTYLGQQRMTLQIISQKLLLMSGHEAFFLFKNCLTMPKGLHLLRSSSCFESSDLELEREILSTLVNIHLTDVSSAQASFPVRWGGVGVRSITDLAPSAFLASSHLVSSILSPNAKSCFNATLRCSKRGITQFAG